MLFGGFFGLLLLVALVGGGIWLARSLAYSPPGRDRLSSGLDILEQRYARGEIERDEYLQKKRDMLAGGAG